jgi:hypothetical protein
MKSFLILEYLPKFLYYTKTDVLWDRTLDLNISFAGGIKSNLAYNSAMSYSISI